MKKNNTIEINGIEFRKCKGLRDKHVHYMDLSECYAKPSWKKRDIFDDWRLWFNDVSANKDCECFGIHACTCNFFSLIMQFEYNNHIYRCWVTYKNNWIEEVC